MTMKLTLTITSTIGCILAMAFYLIPEFVTLQQFPDAEGQGLKDLITLRYALGSLIACIVIITFQLRNVEGKDAQKSIILGYGIGFLVISITNLILQLSGKISAIPPIVATALIALLSLYTYWSINNLDEGK